MKKYYTLLLIIIAIIALGIKVFANNYNYKVYNSALNKTYTAVLGTMSITDDRYVFGFYTKEGQPLCVINLNTNKNKEGLVGGQCAEINAFIKVMSGDTSVNPNSPKNTLGWRELSPNTFSREISSLKQEREQQGKHVFGSDVNVSNEVNPRYKSGQSDEEICIRNNGGAWSCLQDKNYAKLVANIMKNGGCITSVPDMGQMYRDWKYCQNTKETINILYLPSGETKVLNDVGISTVTMSDEEYRQEIQEYHKQYK